MQELSDNIHRMLYNRCTLDRGTISYSVPYDTGHLWIRDSFTVDPYLKFKLKQINSTLSFKWDRLSKCWNIIHKRIGQMPYVVMPVKNVYGNYCPINEKTFKQINRSIQWSARGIARQARDMEIKEEQAREKLDKDDKQNAKDFAKAIASPVMTLYDANGGYWGNSTFMFQGTGDSKVNIDDTVNTKNTATTKDAV